MKRSHRSLSTIRSAEFVDSTLKIHYSNQLNNAMKHVKFFSELISSTRDHEAMMMMTMLLGLFSKT
ncbi:CLUMA_CG014817, isoform A [Clunio marinus]|uniref:CLUMA_CG014817, isoform A n=1 Tax=Clunio marinus TaxID=568069 RepID=A0A1J1IRB2_9DIPT|nr:CLUMA_CG014817, isoform A [Clunio marinus]